MKGVVVFLAMNLHSATPQMTIVCMVAVRDEVPTMLMLRETHQCYSWYGEK